MCKTIYFPCNLPRSFSIVVYCSLTSLVTFAQRKVPFNDSHIRYQGRIVYTPDAAELSWSGSSVTLSFHGSSLTATMKDSDTANYYNVIVDGNITAKIHTDTTTKKHVLASGLPLKKHTIQLYKRTEWAMGKTSFYGFETTSKTKLLTTPLPKRKIEFYGNSITCGYAMEDSSGGDSRHGYFENNYLSYAAIIARHFNAQCNQIAKSGIGIMLSWFPMIMPEMYDRTDATDSASKWNFKQYTPDVVVINLFQNDSWLVKMTDHPEFEHRFGTTPPTEAFIVDAYKAFVQTIRSKYPNAYIICALGNMDATQAGSPWPSYVEKATASLQDAKILTHFFPYKNTPGHPKVNEQQAMADSLIKFIEEKVKW